MTDPRKGPFRADLGLARRFVILDRDGTIIVERHYLADPGGVELIRGAARGLRRLQDLGLGLVVATNQSAIARGYFDLTRLGEIHARLCELLAAEGVTLDGVYVCPHKADDCCGCRKPLPGLVEAASRELHFDPRASFYVGDKPCDINLGKHFGAVTFLVGTGHGQESIAAGATADYFVADLAEAAGIIAGISAAE